MICTASSIVCAEGRHRVRDDKETTAKQSSYSLNYDRAVYILRFREALFRA
jgi:hypothetical protein